MKLPLKDHKFILLLVSIAIVIALEILALAGMDIPMPYAPFVFGTFIIGIGYPVLKSGIKALLKLNFSSINLLMIIAVISAFYLGEYPEAAVVIVLYVLGERLEDIGIENSKSALDNLVSKSPKSAFVKSLQSSVPIDKINIGTVIQVKPHDLIPLDGMIVAGESSIDEATITGEPIPKFKTTGDQVYSGTLNTSGFLEIRTTKLLADTTFSKIVQLTFEASAHKSESQIFIQRFAKVYTPLILILAAMVLIVPVFILGQDFDPWLKQAVTLLIIACPCALVISTPVAIYAAIGNASARGILIKGGKYLEAMSRVTAICFDKTRTITYGTPVVSDVIALNGTSHEELLACAAGAEIFSEHPVAQAIVGAARKEGYTIHATEKFESVVGKGITARCLVCEDETILAGKLPFIREYQPVSDEAEETVRQLSEEGKTSVVVSFGHGVAGIIGLMDEIKPDSKAALQEIRKMGIEPIILTGDNELAADYTARLVNVDKVYSGLLPEDKARMIKELTATYSGVAMVGDGINDAPALALSTVSIAMGAAGSDTAIETANIALMNDRLSLIPFLIRLGKRTVSTIKRNTAFAILIKVIFVLLAISGFSNLVLAITADVGVTLVVIMLSLRLLHFEQPSKQTNT